MEKPQDLASHLSGTSIDDVLAIHIFKEAVTEHFDANHASLVDGVTEERYDFDDYMQHLEFVDKMGRGTLAGVKYLYSKSYNHVFDERRFAEWKARLKKWTAMISSMTYEERKNPDLLIFD